MTPMPSAETNSTAQQALEKIADGKFDLIELVGLADGFSRSGDVATAISLYRAWIEHNTQHPLRYAAAFNCGIQLMNSGDPASGAQLFQLALELKPDFTPARVNLATALERCGKAEDALASLREIVSGQLDINRNSVREKVLAYRNIARLSDDPEIGEAALRQAIELDPTQLDLVHHWANYRHSRCVWPVLHPVGKLSVADLEALMLPLFMSMTTDDPRRLFDASQAFMDRSINEEPIITAGRWPMPVSAKKKIKVAYLSSDLRYHPIGYLMEDLFAFHDTSRFEIYVYNIGDPADDPLKHKIEAAVSSWQEVRTLSDKALAAKIVADGIDILLDINGHTKFQRPRMLAMKPAPIIVNWLGYPGTMGTRCHDYIIADDFIIPPSHERFYGEKVLRLPCYQPNSALCDVPQTRYSKTLLGLPESGFVFCCFNGMVKITPDVFSRWMTILRAVPDSVLWLRGSGNDAPVQLRKEAQACGVDPRRLVVLEFQPHTEYYACHRYADLFLDTFPYGAHTTASDALRMAIPIVTLAGEGFPSKVCGSLLNTVGLPEMVCTRPSQYVDLAIELGNHPVRMQEIKARLQHNLQTSYLFDPATQVKHLEELFEGMWQNYCSGVGHGNA
jgi:predicted O-linked N-acetylglucosamine transferase (SPINDLY family)